MGYYKELKRVNAIINEKIEEIVKGSIQSININRLKLFITNNYEIGEKYIDRRIDLILKTNSQLRIDSKGDLVYER